MEQFKSSGQINFFQGENDYYRWLLLGYSWLNIILTSIKFFTRESFTQLDPFL